MKFFVGLLVGLAVFGGYFLWQQTHHVPPEDFRSSLAASGSKDRSPTTVSMASVANLSSLDDKAIKAMSEDQLIASINKSIFEITKASQINELIDRLVQIANFNEHKDKNQVQLYVAVIKPLKAFEAITWRLRPVVEVCPPCHMMAINFIRQAYHNDYMTGPHIDALLRYLTEPSDKLGMFKDVAKVQDYVSTRIIEDMKASLKLTQDVLARLDNAPDYFMELDTRLLTGHDENHRYISEKNMTYKVVKGNVHYVKAGFERALAIGYYVINYDLNDAPLFVDQMIRSSGLNSALNDFKGRFDIFDSVEIMDKLPSDITAREVIAKLNKREFSKLGQLRLSESAAKTNLEQSKKHFLGNLVSRAEGLQSSWSQTKGDMKNSGDYVLSPRVLAVDYDDSMLRLRNRIDLFSGKQDTFTSEVTGDNVRIVLNLLFEPYSDLKKVFLPRARFTSTARKLRTSAIDADTKRNIVAWDYKYGELSPNAYPQIYFDLFPGLTTENFHEKIRTLKTIPATRVFAWVLPL